MYVKLLFNMKIEKLKVLVIFIENFGDKELESELLQKKNDKKKL